MKCGMPMPWASERATRTACAEQHDASASLASSAHSSSVTATAPSPVSSAATAESTPPLMATSVRPGSSGTAADARAASAQRPVQRVGGQLGRVQLARRQPAELVGDLARADARGVEQLDALATSATAAEPAAVIAPQPEASKPAAATREPSTRSETEIRSPQAAPPAAPLEAPAGARPFPCGNCRCSLKASALTRRV